MRHKILLLEDDLQLNDTIKQFLEHHRYEIVVAYDAYRARDLIYELDFDLMLLDIKVPYQSGFDLLDDIRKEGNSTPAIFITSLHSVEDVTRGFDVGCDDYIRKPFALRELLVRIESHIKRQFGSYDDMIELDGGVVYYPKEFKLTKDTQTISLKKKEAKLLKIFLEHQNQLLSYDKIFESLWEYGEEPSSGSLRTYVKTIRSIIGKRHIETIKNIGYRFVS
jgi:DNA-binding response OmpR family regulator